VSTAIEPVLALCSHGHFHPERVEMTLYGFDDAPEAWLDPTMRTAASRIGPLAGSVQHERALIDA
jgi:hypothetical protein